MNHYAEGELRTLLDEGGLDEARRHAAACTRCARTLDRVQSAAGLAGARLTVLDGATADVPVANPSVALQRFKNRTGVGSDARIREGNAGMSEFGKRRFRPIWAGGALALALVAALLATPVRSAAVGLFDIFRVERFAAIAIDPSQAPFNMDTEGMARKMAAQGRLGERQLRDGEKPDPNVFGTYSGPMKPEAPKRVASLEAAKAVVGYEPAVAGDAVAGRKLSQIYASEGVAASYTFDTAKIRAALKAKGVRSPLPVPEQIDGKTFTLRTSDGVWMQYGAEERSVVFAQGPSPELEIPQGVNMDYLRQDFLSIPGLPQDLVSQVKEIEDWEHTLVVPLPPNGKSREVKIDGAEGLLISDKTGEYNAVLWQRDGSLYALGGKLSQDAVLDEARDIEYR